MNVKCGWNNGCSHSSFPVISYFLLPYLTKTIHNWIDFGIEIGKLFIMVAIIGTIVLMRMCSLRDGKVPLGK